MHVAKLHLREFYIAVAADCKWVQACARWWLSSSTQSNTRNKERRQLMTVLLFSQHTQEQWLATHVSTTLATVQFTVMWMQ